MTNVEFKIEKSVPIPTGKADRDRYPFNEMKVGDSFFVPLSTHKNVTVLQTNLMGNARYFTQKNNPDWKFKSKMDGEKGVRIWRVK